MTADRLVEELADVAQQLALGIDAQRRRMQETAHQPWGVPDPWMAVDPNGRPILLDALAARGQVLAALAALVARS